VVSFPPLSPPKTYTLPSSRGYIIILSTHLRLGLPSGLFPTGFPTKTLNTPTTPKIHPNIINPSTPRSAEPVSQQRPYTLPCTQTSILKLYTILRPGLPSALFPYGFPTKTQYTPSPNISILLLFTHLRLGLPSGLFPSIFPTKNLYTDLSRQIHTNIIHPSTPSSPQWTLSFRFPHLELIHPTLPVDPL